MPNKRRNARRSRPKAVANSISSNFVINMVSNAIYSVTQTDLGIDGAWQYKPAQCNFTVAAVNDDNNNIPIVQVALIAATADEQVAVSRPILCTNIPQRSSVRAPTSTDWGDNPGNSNVVKITVSNINTSQAIVITLTGTVKLHLKPSATPRPVTVLNPDLQALSDM